MALQGARPRVARAARSVVRVCERPSAHAPRVRAPGCRPRGHAGSRSVLRDSAARTVRVIDVDEVEVIVAHQERATLRVGAVFLKIDGDQTRTDIEIEAMRLAPVPTPQVLWRKPPV